MSIQTADTILEHVAETIELLLLLFTYGNWLWLTHVSEGVSLKILSH